MVQDVRIKEAAALKHDANLRRVAEARFQNAGVRRPGCPEGWDPATYGVPKDDQQGPGMVLGGGGKSNAYRVPALRKTELCHFHGLGICRRGQQ
jgi:hypothetical protein